MNKPDPLLDLAMQLEEVALADDYFVERKLYPNVDFYTGVIYKAMGFPTDVHGAVRTRPLARLDRAVARDDGRPDDAHRPPPPDLCRPPGAPDQLSIAAHSARPAVRWGLSPPASGLLEVVPTSA